MKLKKQFLNLAIILSCTIATAQTIQWTWMKGSNTVDQTGTYGTIGVAATNNKPGARLEAVSWTDASGNLWLYGGVGYNNTNNVGNLSDLWKYNSINNKWAWIGGTNLINQSSLYGTLGVASTTNMPGSRQSATSWTDASGNLWLFGGYGYSSTSSSGLLNDLWKFNPTTNEWTWVSGANITEQVGIYGTIGVSSTTNIPGARHSCVSWVDANGIFWIYGGYGHSASTSTDYLNDLWKFNPLTNEWTWVSGSNLIAQHGAYGTLGTPSSTTVPGGRLKPNNWMDSNGNLWLFGGSGYPATGASGYLNDLWKYDPNTNQWTWIGGSSLKNRLATYGTLGVASTANIPGSRQQALGWKDAAGDFWLFSGDGYASVNGTGELNDLWKYTFSTNQWAWMGGNNIVDQGGTYGTQGVGSNTNIPGGRNSAVAWLDALGNMWSFGGMGYDASATYDNLNDLWKMSIVTSCTAPAAPTDASLPANLNICSGNHTTLTATGSGTLSWYSSLTSTSPIATGSSYTTNALGVGGSPYTFYVEANTCTVSATRTPITVTVNALPIISVNSGSICVGGSFTMVPGGASTYTFSSGSAIVSPITTSTYAVSGTSSAGCQNLLNAISTVSVMPSPTVSIASSAISICSGQSATFTASGASSYNWNTGATTSSISVSPTTTTVYSVTGIGSNGCSNTKSVNIIVNSTPTISANNVTICPGNSTTLSASGATSYTWNPGPITGSSIVVAPLSSIIYTITGASSGCTNTKTVSILVNANPTVTASNATICSGQTTTLSASGASTYTWSTGATTSTISVTLTGSTNYTVTGANAGGCTNTKTVSVSVNPLPNVTATSATICSGSTGTITASGASTYSWNTGALTANLVASPSSSTIYTVTGTSAASCVKTATASITVGPAPSISVNSATICAGATATLTASGVSTYTWNTTLHSSSITVNPISTSVYTVTGNLLGCTSTAMQTATVTVNPSPIIAVNSGTICTGASFTMIPSGASSYTFSSGSAVVMPTTNTSYTVSGTSSNGCQSTTNAVSSVTVKPLPNITASSNPTLICIGQSATLSAIGASTYTWNTNATTTVIVVAPVITTTYTVTGTGNNGCSKSINITQNVSACTDIASQENIETTIFVYPNPSNGSFTFDLKSQTTIMIYDAIGNLIYHQVLPTGKQEVSLNENANGIYLLKAVTQDKQYIKRLIKQ